MIVHQVKYVMRDRQNSREPVSRPSDNKDGRLTDLGKEKERWKKKEDTE